MLAVAEQSRLIPTVARFHRWLARWEIEKEKNRDDGGEEGDLHLAEEYLKEVASVQEDKDVRQAFDLVRLAEDMRLIPCPVHEHRRRTGC